MLHYSNKHLFFLIALLVLAFSASAQLSSLRNQQLWIKADDTFEYGDYMNALLLYEQLNDLDSTVEEIHYKIAVCITSGDFS